jgi:hypothetical protein
MFEAKSIDGRLVDLVDQPQALVEGDEVVAVVFEERYIDVFGQALQMLELVSRVSTMPCDFDADSTHPDDCKACGAKLILASISSTPRIH